MLLTQERRERRRQRVAVQLEVRALVENVTKGVYEQHGLQVRLLVIV